MNFNELMKGITKNVDYWAWKISSETSIEKEDAYQDLLIIVWKEYCSRVSKGKITTRYFMQKRLNYAYMRILRSFYHSVASITSLFDEDYREVEDIIDERFEKGRIKEWFNLVSDYVLLDNEAVEERVKLIFSMLKQGYKNSEIAKSLGIKQNTLSLLITRKIKKPLKEELEKYPFSNKDGACNNDYVEIYS